MTIPTARHRHIAIALGSIAAVIVLGVIPWRYHRAESQAKEEISKERASREHVLAVLATQAEAWNRGDLDGYMDGYWDNPELEFISGPTTTKGFQPVKDRYFQRYKANGQEMGQLTFSELEYRRRADRGAEVTGLWRVVKTTDTLSGGFTVQLREFDFGWKVVQDTTTSDDPPKKD